MQTRTRQNCQDSFSLWDNAPVVEMEISNITEKSFKALTVIQTDSFEYIYERIN